MCPTTTTTTATSTTLISISTSSGVPVLVPCSNYPTTTLSPQSRCGSGYFAACPSNTCCSENGFCQSDGGDNDARYCGARCWKCWGKCWANITYSYPYPYTCDAVPYDSSNYTVCPGPTYGYRSGQLGFSRLTIWQNPATACLAFCDQVGGCDYVAMDTNCLAYSSENNTAIGIPLVGGVNRGWTKGNGRCPIGAF